MQKRISLSSSCRQWNKKLLNQISLHNIIFFYYYVLEEKSWGKRKQPQTKIYHLKKCWVIIKIILLWWIYKNKQEKRFLIKKRMTVLIMVLYNMKILKCKIHKERLTSKHLCPYYSIYLNIVWDVFFKIDIIIIIQIRWKSIEKPVNLIYFNRFAVARRSKAWSHDNKIAFH